MSRSISGSLTAFFLYDVAEAIDLPGVATIIGSTEPARMAAKPPAPPYIQYTNPPVTLDGRSFDAGGLAGWEIRFKAFDYGVVSVALTRPLPATWEAMASEGLTWHDSPALAGAAEQACRTFLARVRPALDKPRSVLLSEDYLAFGVTRVEGLETAEALLRTHGADIAQLLRGEREALSGQERDDVLRHRISYLSTDVVIPTWNTAFIFDTPPGIRGVLEILEFANSQLLEFRYYDGLLDGELARIYAELERHGWLQNFFGRRFTQAARHVHSLFIEVNELTDKTENALKVAGDVYAARLFNLAGPRLGLDHWKGNVQDKLKTLDDIYRFAVEQTAMARGEILELTIVLILIFELGLFFAGLR
jgi:hypothetical protein